MASTVYENDKCIAGLPEKWLEIANTVSRSSKLLAYILLSA